MVLDWPSRRGSETAFSLKKKHTSWPSQDGLFGALWVGKDPDEARSHIENLVSAHFKKNTLQIC